MKSVILLFLKYLVIIWQLYLQEHSGIYECAVDYYQSQGFIDNMEKLKAIFAKIDSAKYRKLILAKTNEAKENVADSIIKSMHKSGTLPDYSSDTGKEFYDLFQFVKPGAARADESKMIYDEMLKELNLSHNNITVYRKPLPRSTELIFYGITDMELINKICCVIRNIRNKNNTAPVILSFYEKENLSPIYEEQEVSLMGRQDEKRIAYLLIE